MTEHREQTAVPDKKKPEGQTPSGNESGEAREDHCRCKEVSKMRPAEMLKLVIGDLAFWRKARRHE